MKLMSFAWESRFTLVLLAGVAALTFAAMAHADDSGTQLAQRVYDRADGKDSTALTTMTLTEAGRSPRVRRMVSYRLKRKPGEIAVLTRFTEPADISGTGLLTLDHPTADSDQWIYLPAMDRVRRISASRKGGRFVNSEYYYEDLRDRKPAQDQHHIIRRETLNGVVCEVLESIPVEAGNSVYLKRVSWIDPATLLPLQVEYYEKNLQEPSKRMQAKKTGKVQGYWIVLDSTITDLASGNQTRLTLDKIVFDRRLPAQLFTTQALEDESVEEEYRP
ncbi:MAG: outer membrane lipoprotein-sorting protein [Burkholderiales bacterium]|nr:outer membrane lipoprotein-sorting protein [Burkholderiales bacterium]